MSTMNIEARTFGSLFTYTTVDETNTPFKILYRDVTIINTVDKDVVRGAQFAVAILDVFSGIITFYTTMHSFTVHLT
jgi:hypothetical protein